MVLINMIMRADIFKEDKKMKIKATIAIDDDR